MNESRYASLSGSLLARKGGAKPAMRPRPLSTGQMLDDLGWDDMGDAFDPPSQHVPSPIAALTPAPKAIVARDETPAVEEAPVRAEPPVRQEPVVRQEQPVRPEQPVRHEPPVHQQPVARDEVPPVHAQQRSLSERFGPAEPIETPNLPEAVVAALRTPRSGSGTKKSAPRQAGGRKAAFTLRLDGDRHLKLRLASAVTGKSSQLLVTAALDSFLETLPEIGTMARHMPARARSSN